jgi:UDP-N-acetylglucosamine 2-epimerase (non-hydrolysing)
VVSVLCVAGTRPEIIKMAPVIKALQRYSDVDLTFIHSGQHYDTNMSKVFIQELGLPEPTENLRLRHPPAAQITKTGRVRKIPPKISICLILLEVNINTVLSSFIVSINADTLACRLHINHKISAYKGQ